MQFNVHVSRLTSCMATAASLWDPVAGAPRPLHFHCRGGSALPFLHVEPSLFGSQSGVTVTMAAGNQVLAYAMLLRGRRCMLLHA